MTITLPGTAELEQKIDALAAQVAFLTEEARLAQERRRRLEELQHDLLPIATDALAVVGRELEDAEIDMAELSALLKRFLRVAPLLDRALGQVEMYAELVGEVTPIGHDALALTTEKLGTLEERGYFAFAKGAARVADRVVTGFSEEDIEALGDNVVLILNTVKDLTQPEVMAALHRMIDAVQRQQRQMAAEPTEPPSLLSIARQLRDPEIRRGIARGLNTLRAVSEAETGSQQGLNQTKKPSGGN